MELFNMQKNYNFLIDSEPSKHTLSLNLQKIGTFSTLEAAEAEANKIARHTIADAKLVFGLDFKWTISDFESRVATLECESAEAIQRQSSGHDERDSLCG
jgi:hypothetical protein